MKTLAAFLAITLVGCGPPEPVMQRLQAKAEADLAEKTAALQKAEATYAAAVSERVAILIEEESGVPQGELERLTEENVRLFAELKHQSGADAAVTEAAIESNLKLHRELSERMEGAVTRVEKRIVVESEAKLFGSLPESKELEAVRARAREADEYLESVRKGFDD